MTLLGQLEFAFFVSWCLQNVPKTVRVQCSPQEWTQMPVATSVATNNQLAIVANRFNYVFNLKGEPWEGAEEESKI